MGIFSAGRPLKYRPFENEGKKPPQSPGVYRIRSEQGNVMYVGETVNLCKRMNEHIKKTGNLKKGESFEYKIASPNSDSSSRRQVEKQKIAKYHPTRNRSSGGEGRPATR